MTRDEFLKRWPHATASTLARNGFAPVGAVGGPVREPSPHPALVKDPQTQPVRKGRLGVIVKIISCRNRVCDSDNSAMGTNKALRDAIAKSLAVDDGSEQIRFEYGQLHTTGPEGTIVRIEWA